MQVTCTVICGGCRVFYFIFEGKIVTFLPYFCLWRW